MRGVGVHGLEVLKTTTTEDHRMMFDDVTVYCCLTNVVHAKSMSNYHSNHSTWMS